MPEPQPPRTLLSYARADIEFARQLRERLIAEGLDPPWHDQTHMSAGEWWDQIEAVLTSPACEHVILVLSPAALTQDRHLVVKREWKLARREGKTVLPVIAPGGLTGSDRALMPGWMNATHAFDFEGADADSQWANFIAELKTPGRQPRRPFMVPAMPEGFVARPEEFAKLKAALLDTKGNAVAITAALRGAGGFGKTVLAQALAHDDDILDAFHDGVLWITLGEKPSVIEKLADLLKTLTGEPQGFTEVSAAANKLREVLAERKCLLVIDDVWSEGHLRPFTDGAPLTARLVTTRIPELPREAAVRLVVDKMTVGQALALLKRGLPTPGREEDAALSKLATDGLRNWPILIGIVNGILSRYTSGDHPEPLAAGIKTVAGKLDADGVLGFDAAIETDRNKSVARTIEVGLDVLDEHDATRRKGGVPYPAGYHRARYRELALYPEDTEIPITTIGRLWGARGVLRAAEAEVAPFDPRATDDELRRQMEADAKRREAIAHEARELVERFYGLALLEALNRATKTVRIHDVMRKYLTEQQAPEVLKALHHQFVDAYDAASGPDIEDAEERLYFYTWFPTHLHEAGEREVLDGLLLDPQWMQRKLDALEGPGPLIADYRNFAEMAGQAAYLTGQTLDLMAGILRRDTRQLLPQLLARLQLDQLTANDVRTSFKSQSDNPTESRESARLSVLLGRIRDLLISPSLVPRWASFTAAGGPEIHRYAGHSQCIAAVAFSPDGRSILSGSWDRSLRLWDIASGSFNELSGHTGFVTAAAFSSDGRSIISASFDATLRLWDVATSQSRLFVGHMGPVHAVVISPDGGTIASGSEDKTLRLWEVASGQYRELSGHSQSVNALAFSPDGCSIVSGSNDKTLRLWNVATGQSCTLTGHTAWVDTVAFSPDGRSIVSGSADSTLRLWDVASRQSCELTGHTGVVEAVTFSPDGASILSGSWDKTLRLWEVASGQSRILTGHWESVKAVAFSPDGRNIASGGRDNTLRLWEISSNQPQKCTARKTIVTAVAFSPDGRTIASGGWNTKLRLREVGSVHFDDFVGHESAITSVAFSPDGRSIVSGSWDSTLRLWDIASRQCRKLSGHKSEVTAVAYSPDGRTIVSGSHDRTLRLWEVEGSSSRELVGHTHYVTAVAFSPDGRSIVSGSMDGTLRQWDIVNGSCRELPRHGGLVHAVAFSPDGRSIVSGSSAFRDTDNALCVWNISSGQSRSFADRMGEVRAVAFSPNGRSFITANSDNTLRLWDFDRQSSCVAKLLSRFDGDGIFHCVAVSPDGLIIVAGDAGGGVHLLDVVGMQDMLSDRTRMSSNET